MVQKGKPSRGPVATLMQGTRSSPTSDLLRHPIPAALWMDLRHEARLRGLAAQECDFECCASKQAIELMGLVLARVAGEWAVVKTYPIPGRASRHDLCHHVSAADPDGARTARRTSIGTSSRIGVSTMAGWCSDRFCIWERSIRRRPPLGVKRRGIRHGGEPRTLALFPEDAARRRWPMTPRGCVFACQRSSCTGRGNGGRAAGGSAVARAAAGPVLGRPPAAEPKGDAGTRFSRFWWPIG